MNFEHKMEQLMRGLSIANLHKSFGETLALRGVSFEIAQGEIVALLGPSGCGKSTLLSLIAGLEIPDQGEIGWNGASLGGIPPHKRAFGLMFQDYMLFPHKNVGSNVAFGLEMAHWAQGKMEARVAETLEMVGLSGYTKRDVSTLSGGEQQRVALARALAPHPRLLMLDEPLGALDRALRERLLVELGQILRAMKQTALYVTHDQEEAFALADRVVVMDQGQVAQIGTPQEIYRRPTSVFVAQFLGLGNILAGKIHNGKLQTKIGEFEIGGFETRKDGSVSVMVRPDAMRLEGVESHQVNGIICGQVFRGSLCRVQIEIQGALLTFEFPSATPLPKTGETIRLGFDPEEAFLIL